MTRLLVAALFSVGIFFGVLVCLRFGWRIGRRRLAELGEGGHAGLGAVEGSVFGLVGLLIAFTFTGAAARFDARRELIIAQVNAIGTAWLRLDLLPEGPRAELRELFRNYVDTQTAMTGRYGDQEALADAVVRLADLQDRIWRVAVAAAAADTARPIIQAVLPPLNDMFDATTSRHLVTRQHPHVAIFVLLGVLVLVGAVMAGFGMAKAERQSRLHAFGFAMIMACSIYFILDLEFPRLGLVRVDAADEALVELRAGMN